MQAYISSSIDASVLLRGLEGTAASITGYSPTLNGVSKRIATESPSVRIMKTIDGQPTYLTIVQHNQRTLLASLENEERLITPAARSRLAALLIPLVTEYINSHRSDPILEDRVRIVFGETAATKGRGKTCVLFAEDAKVHLRPAVPSRHVLFDRSRGQALINKSVD